VFPPFYETLFATFAFVLGACIGSFLNVCIYRMPLDMSVNEPKRSFCPSCKYQIPLHHNIPLLTWLVLRGKCANCGARISFRYLGVELLTGLLFLAVWWKVWAWGAPGWPAHAWVLALPYWIMVALFVVATFIDFEHFIIPDEITIGGTVAGVMLSFAIPTLHGQTANLLGGLWSLVGAGAGYGALWLVVQLGKMAFGKKTFEPRSVMAFSWTRRIVETPTAQESDADLIVGDVSWKQRRVSVWRGLMDTLREILQSLRILQPKSHERGESWIWSDTFGMMRESERLVMRCPVAEIDGVVFSDVALSFSHTQVSIGGRTWELEKVDKIVGQVASLVIPREAMGFGDVKFIACVGAFLGWKAVVFTIMSASMFGALIGLATIAIGRREWSAKIPFGPYLALGALLWLFAGPELVRWYLDATLPPVG
jgi:leader peptidase (prepilin peptidase)/N-methyltransferase